jgi:hypothetical protein
VTAQQKQQRGFGVPRAGQQHQLVVASEFVDVNTQKIATLGLALFRRFKDGIHRIIDIGFLVFLQPFVSPSKGGTLQHLRGLARHLLATLRHKSRCQRPTLCAGNQQVTYKIDGQVRIVQRRLAHHGPKLDLPGNAAPLGQRVCLGLCVQLVVDAFSHAHGLLLVANCYICSNLHRLVNFGCGGEHRWNRP